MAPPNSRDGVLMHPQKGIPSGYYEVWMPVCSVFTVGIGCPNIRRLNVISASSTSLRAILSSGGCTVGFSTRGCVKTKFLAHPHFVVITVRLTGFISDFWDSLWRNILESNLKSWLSHKHFVF